MLINSKDNIVRAVPLSEIQELIYYNGYPSEECLKSLYENGFILIKIINDKYYFANRNTLLDSPFIVRLK